jgi:hypothetical protein
MLTYANEHRYQMPWRWRLWSQLYAGAVENMENLRPEPINANKMNLNPLSGLPDSAPAQINEQTQLEA